MDAFKPSTSAGSQAQERVRELKRVTQFAGKVVQALRQDFAALWAVEGEVPGLGPAQLKAAAAFRQALDELTITLQQAEAAIALTPAPGSPEAARLAARFNPAFLAERTREVQGQARQLAATPTVRLHAAAALAPGPRPQASEGVVRPQAQGAAPPASGGRPQAQGAAPPGSGGRPQAPGGQARTGPLQRPQTAPLAPGTGRLGAWLQRKLEPVKAEALAPPPVKAASPLEQSFGQARSLVGKVLARMTRELTILAAAMEAVRLPGPGRPADQLPAAIDAASEARSLDPVQRTWVPPVTRRLQADPQAVKSSAVALTSFDTAQRLHTQAEALAPRVATLPTDRAALLLAGFELASYRASILPLSHLHITFKDTPVFQKLFPPPTA